MKYYNAILLACAGVAFAGPIAPRQDDTDEDVSACNKLGLDADQCMKATDPTKQVDFGDLEACIGEKSKAAKSEDETPTCQETKPTSQEKKPTGVNEKTATKDKSAASN